MCELRRLLGRVSWRSLRRNKPRLRLLLLRWHLMHVLLLLLLLGLLGTRRITQTQDIRLQP